MNLLTNPFYVLGASCRDDRAEIFRKSEETSLVKDPRLCTQSRIELLQPRKRLFAEAAWLLGISPKRASEITQVLRDEPGNIMECKDLPPISRVNLLASTIETIDSLDAETMACWILDILETFEAIKPEVVIGLINEDRIVSGFPLENDLSLIESVIQDRRKYYKEAMRVALDKQYSREIIRSITRIVEKGTNHGRIQGPLLMQDIIDIYEIETQEFMEIEENNIKEIIESFNSVLDGNKKGDTGDLLIVLFRIIKNWDFVAQPLQLSKKASGQFHESSRRVLNLVRNFAIHIFNEHSKIDYAIRITRTLQEVFEEVPEIKDLLGKDYETIRKIEKDQYSFNYRNKR